ncbi:rhamnogalacturonan endolyase family protein [Streptomyces sp. SAS_270]|uniref:rhamnogalacturonan endolyase family protein n=1 Tax=Streptomyces sp. SAS_270 TaxID=3412748 RepID=UPI00403CD716
MTDARRCPALTAQPLRPRNRSKGRLICGITTATASAFSALAGLPQTAQAATARQVERLDRALTNVHTGSGSLVSWRWLALDPSDVVFHV